MTSATVSGVPYAFAVNALGQRYLKSGNGATMLYAYDTDGRLLGQYDGSGQLVQETVWFAGMPVATIRPGGAVYQVHADHLGTPRLITRPADNTIMWRWDGEPFGSTPPDENASGEGVFRYDLRFPGQVADPETALLQNGFRDYSPALGRYVESDPIGLEGGINTYGYVSGNPLAITDSLGLLGAGTFAAPFLGQIVAPILGWFKSVMWNGHNRPPITPQPRESPNTDPPPEPERDPPPSVCYGMPQTFPHYWLCANGVCGGLVPGAGGEFGGRGEVRREKPGMRPNGAATLCQKINDDKCDTAQLASCIATAVQGQQGNLTYHLGTHNCQDWAWETVQRCRRVACNK